MNFEREWTIFAVDAEVDHFGTARLVKAHNDLRERNRKMKALVEAIKEAPKTKNRSNIACLVYTTQIDDALANLKDRSPSQAWLRKMADAEDQIEGGLSAGNMEDGEICPKAVGKPRWCECHGWQYGAELEDGKMSERCARTVHANGDWGDYRCELDDGHGGSHAIGVRSLLADRKALVRYVRAQDAFRLTLLISDEYKIKELTKELREAYKALSQELRDEIADLEAHEKIQEAM